MDRALDLAASRSTARLGFKIRGAAELDNIAVCILHDFLALDDVRMLEADLPARLEAEILLRRLLHKVFLLDIDLAGERHEAAATVHRIVVSQQVLLFILRIVRDDDLQRTQHCHDAIRMLIEVIAYAVLKHADIDQAVALGDADLLTEVAQRCRRITAAAQARNGRHARIVPAAYIALFDKLAQLALARDRVREIETCKLDLARARIDVKAQ